MKNKFLFFLLISAAGLLATTIVFLILITGDGKSVIYEPSDFKSIEEFKTSKIKLEFEKMVVSTDREFEVSVDEEDLNHLLSLVFYETEYNDDLNVTGYRVEIVDENIMLFFDSYFLKIIPVQYKFKIKPIIENNRLGFVVKESKLGIVNIPPKIALKRLMTNEFDEFYVDIQRQTIVLNNDSYKQILFSEMFVENDKLKIRVALYIESLDDLLKVLTLILDEDIRRIVEIISFDDISNISTEIIKDITMSKLNDLGYSLQGNILESIVDYIEEGIAPTSTSE